MVHTSKRLSKAYTNVNREMFYRLSEAIKQIKSTATAKFDETLEISVHLGVDPRHADQMVRGMVQLPHGTGKTLRVAVFATGQKAQEAEQAGADIVGAEELATQIQKGEIAFERCIAAPELMSLVGKLGKVLGPRGLMPNPKLGTVTNDITTAVKAAKAGNVPFRVEKAGIVHGGIGKMSFPDHALIENVRSFVEALQRSKPSGAKGTYIRKITLGSSMGPSIKVDLTSLNEAAAA